MKNVLVPIDFSVSSAHAALYAAQLSHKLKPTKIILLHCFEPDFIVSEIPLSPPYYTDDLNENSVKQLNDLKEKLVSAKNAPTEIEVITSDKPIIQTITALIEEQNIELIISGTTEKGALEKILLGSHTLNIIKLSTVPVLVIPNSELSFSIHNIAFAINLKDSTRVPVNDIQSVVSAFDSKLFIVNVAENGREDSYADIVRNQQYLYKHWNSENTEYHYVNNKDIAAGIKAFINEYEIQMLILVPKQYSFFESLFHSSVTKEFSFDNSIPVMFINEKIETN